MKPKKTTVSLGPLELGQIDYLAEKGLYVNRTDFIRVAIRKQLEHHTEDITQFLEPNLPETAKLKAMGGLGVIRLGQADINSLLASETKAHIRVVGALIIAKSITATQISQIVSSVKVYGKIFAEDDVKDALMALEGGNIIWRLAEPKVKKAKRIRRLRRRK